VPDLPRDEMSMRAFHTWNSYNRVFRVKTRAKGVIWGCV